MLLYEGNASYLYVANVARGTDTVDGMANGSVAILNEAGTVVTTAQTSGKGRILVKDANGNVTYSPYFDFATIGNKVGKNYVAPVQEVEYIGYNGVSGELDATANENFTVSIQAKNSQFLYSTSPLTYSGSYTTIAASQSELAAGLLDSLSKMMANQPYQWCKIERISNGTFADWTGVATHMSVTNGLKAVTYTNGSGVAAAGEALSDGSTVFIAGATYVVKGTGTTAGFLIDSPYKGATAEVAGGTTYATQCGLATSITKWGLKFTGVENASFNPFNDDYRPVSFDVVSDSFSTATITRAIAPSSGSGYGKQIANIEAYAEFLEKDGVQSTVPRTSRKGQTDITGTYDLITFNVDSKAFTDNATGMPSYATWRVQIAMKEALDYDDLDTVLGITPA